MIAFSNSKLRSSGVGLNCYHESSDDIRSPDENAKASIGLSPLPSRNKKFASGLSSQDAAVLLQKYGKNELPENNIPKW